MKTAITFFSGGGLADVALMSAGFRVVAGLELVKEIAEVANRNLGGHVRVGNILEANPSDYPDADLHHYSPPCTRASVANANATESELDIAFARKIVEFVRVKRPRDFTLENVRGYQKFKAFQIIMEGLKECGYQASVFVLNSASYGVPQTRIRLIVMASLDRKPAKPLPTHQKHQDSQASLFEARLPRWVGWYEAIEDLIWTLPESKFADWQLKRLPAELQSFLVRSGNTKQEWGKGYHLPGEPAMTISTEQVPRAFLITKQEQSQTIRDIHPRFEDEPAGTITADDYRRPVSVPKAFIVDDQNGSLNEDGSRELSIRHSPEPIFTIPASPSHKSSYRAFIVDQQNGSRDSTIRSEAEPMFTTTTYSAKHPAPRAWLNCGKVVKMTPRCLARFMSMPDSYELPSNDALAAKIIGNGFPCLFAQRIFEQF